MIWAAAGTLEDKFSIRVISHYQKANFMLDMLTVLKIRS